MSAIYGSISTRCLDRHIHLKLEMHTYNYPIYVGAQEKQNTLYIRGKEKTRSLLLLQKRNFWEPPWSLFIYKIGTYLGCGKTS